MAAPPAAPPPFQLGLPVPKLLYDAFEEVFSANARRFAKDIAKTLQQPEGPLLEALFKGPAAQVKPYLYEEAAEQELDLRCDYICQRPEAPLFLQPCCAPVLWSAATPGHRRCPQHLYSKPLTAAVLRSLPVLFPLEAEALDPEEVPLFRSEDGTVYDKDFQVRGRYDFPTKSLRLFEVEAEDDE
jgi:hypothetical protein